MPTKKRGQENDLAAIRRSLADLQRGQKKLLEREHIVLDEEKKVEKSEQSIRHAEEALGRKESEMLTNEKREEDELSRLDKLETEIKQEVKIHPLTRITYHDFTKAIVGALFGIVGHFSFFYGTEIAAAGDFTLTRAVILYIVAFVLAILFMYFAGFRKVDIKDMKYLPLRVGVVYLTSLLVILLVLTLFGFITHTSTFIEIFKTVSAISILAVLGAATADLIGKE